MTASNPSKRVRAAVLDRLSGSAPVAGMTSIASLPAQEQQQQSPTFQRADTVEERHIPYDEAHQRAQDLERSPSGREALDDDSLHPPRVCACRTLFGPLTIWQRVLASNATLADALHRRSRGHPTAAPSSPNRRRAAPAALVTVTRCAQPDRLAAKTVRCLAALP